MNRSVALVFALLIAICTIYRIIPYEMRPEWLGAPQLALAVFAGSVIKNRKVAFLLPLASMLVSDVLMQILSSFDPAFYAGFYKGQLINYVLILSTTVIGFFISERKPAQILAGAVAAPVVFFLLSNFQVWAATGGLMRSKTAAGLLQTYIDGLPFLRTSLIGTILFSGVFFGIKALLASPAQQLAKA